MATASDLVGGGCGAAPKSQNVLTLAAQKSEQLHQRRHAQHGRVVAHELHAGVEAEAARQQAAEQAHGQDHEQAQQLAFPDRSEEHTSELQSPDHLVCRLLLEKKKKKTNTETQRCELTHNI